MEILKIEHLSKVYGTGESAVRALDDVSFSVEKGEFVAIIGRPDRGNRRSFICWAGWIGRLAGKFMFRIRTCMP
ncbi:hypothetical protein HMSSN036_04880 [Paenibacillus macerans]|nr:hypothetical protein HMSSN036_04880 [Paenibacillus macerans]